MRQPLRPVAVHLRDAVDRELERQLRDGIIEPVTRDSGPTPWISNLVVVPKGNAEVRLTCDSRALNKAIRRTRFPGKTIDDIIYLVNGAKVFSKLDLVKAFHPLELHPDSRNCTTITTHRGLFRYRRLHMGISCASEMFTETVRMILRDCAGQLNMTDDILVFGKDAAEHDANLLKVLRTLQDNGLTLNADKCQFSKNKIVFFGMQLSSQGVAPTEDRCKTLREVEPPKDVKALRSFLGLLQYSARFIHNVNTLSDPLWRLCKAGVSWKWSETEQKAFDKLKMAISTKCMAFFYPKWHTELIELYTRANQSERPNRAKIRMFCFPLTH